MDARNEAIEAIYIYIYIYIYAAAENLLFMPCTPAGIVVCIYIYICMHISI